jgi:hypothetical protein
MVVGDDDPCRRPLHFCQQYPAGLRKDGLVDVILRSGSTLRGAPPADEEALADLLLRLSQLAADHPEIAELDLNPVLALPTGAVAVDARAPIAHPGRTQRAKSW